MNVFVLRLWMNDKLAGPFCQSLALRSLTGQIINTTIVEARMGVAPNLRLRDVSPVSVSARRGGLNDAWPVIKD
jgi:hypothetical protein